MLPYFIQSALILTLFYAMYKLIFARFTFFQHNRFFLLSGLTVSLIMPLLPLNFSPEKMEYIHLNRNAFDAAIPLNKPIEEAVVATQKMSFSEIIPYIYLTGVVIYSLLMIFQILKVSAIVKNGISIQQNGMNLVFTDKNISPFSFFNTIVLNPSLLTEEQMKHVLIHENIHISHWHQLDVVLTELLKISLWFFPLSWWYGKSVRTNLEYIADDSSLRNGLNKKEYQLNLLAVSLQPQTSSLVNNFSKNLIKSRIEMLNRMRTGNRFSKIYLFSIPLILIISCGVSVKTQSQNAKVKQIIILTEDGDTERVKVIANNRSEHADSTVSDSLIILNSGEKPIKISKNSATILIPKTRIVIDKSNLEKLNLKKELSLMSDEISLLSDSITKDQMLILKNKFKLKGDTIYITKDGIFSTKDFLPENFEKNKSNLENLLKNHSSIPGIPENLNLQKSIDPKEFFPKAQGLDKLPNMTDNFKQEPDYSDYPKLLENWKGGIYSNENILFFERDENGVLKEVKPKTNRRKAFNLKDVKSNSYVQRAQNDFETFVIPEISFQNGKNPKIYIDGKESTLSQLRKIEANKTHQIAYMTSNDAEKIQQYGQDISVNGIIIAQVKK